MDDITPRAADRPRLLRRAGPSEPVDAAAIFTAIAATQSPKWRLQHMFSAAKFVVAGSIVALFGGFLLAGLLTQPSEPLPPAASSASASPEAVPSVGPTTNDLLPGVDLVTEEVEPGVFRVLRDSVRDLAGVRPKGMSVGQDRSVWLWTETPGLRISQGARGAATLLELGEPGETRFDPPASSTRASPPSMPTARSGARTTPMATRVVASRASTARSGPGTRGLTEPTPTSSASRRRSMARSWWRDVSRAGVAHGSHGSRMASGPSCPRTSMCPVMLYCTCIWGLAPTALSGSDAAPITPAPAGGRPVPGSCTPTARHGRS